MFVVKSYVLLFALILLFSSRLFGQVSIEGQVIDGSHGVPIFAANVIELGTTNGVTTDFDGRFILKVESLPVTLLITLIGYERKEVHVHSLKHPLLVKLDIDHVMLEEAQIVGDRISEKQKQAPMTIESMDLMAIKEAPSGNFYEGLGALKGVDLTSASLGFKIINTRGFNSTSPVRSLQLIDGVDNQSPGLNFSLGNFLGASDLDVMKVDIVAGANSAYFGPGAFNGVINMTTKNPFMFPGFSFSSKVGERGLFETAFRLAEVIKNKKDQEVFAYKINYYHFKARDWEAENYDPIDGSRVDASNPGRYDAVNIYGDEYFPAMDFSTTQPWNYRGLGLFYRTGYKESDLVDYRTRNLKGSVSLHLRTHPEMSYDSPELSWTTSVGNGNTVYQGDNRFSLRDIGFMQNKLEYAKKDKFFIRVYATHEDAGNSYDPYATALQMLEETRSDEDWAKVYLKYWNDNIDPKIDDLGYPELTFEIDDEGNFVGVFDYDAWANWLVEYQDSLVQWHHQVEDLTNSGSAGIPGVGAVGFLEPGSPEFESSFARITSRKSNEAEGGTRFYDRSALYHGHAEYIWEPGFLDKIVTGGNVRLYTPDSDGTIFYDTAGTTITNREWGAYLGLEHRIYEDRIILRGTMRVDKNENFDYITTPAASLVYSPRRNDYLRLTYSSALRNPTLADQYLFLDVGPAILSGNLQGAQDLITIESFNAYRNSLNTSLLRYFDIDPIRPEKVNTVEVGYRTSFRDRLYADASFYNSVYDHFIGYKIGIKASFNDINLPEDVQVYRYSANSTNQVRTAGFSIGLNYYLNDLWVVNGNYSFNRLVKTFEDDPIIPAFNTPENKFNIGLNMRGKKVGNSGDRLGFSCNYKWVQGFVFEGSPQFTGQVPAYDILDAQVSYLIDSANTTFKLGASNLLNNLHIETYGGPRIGRLLYASLLYEFDKKN